MLVVLEKNLKRIVVLGMLYILLIVEHEEISQQIIHSAHIKMTESNIVLLRNLARSFVIVRLWF